MLGFGVETCMLAVTGRSTPMPDEFQFDVFLSHSAKDKAVVRPLAERLRADELLNNSQPPPGSDWAQLESDSEVSL